MTFAAPQFLFALAVLPVLMVFARWVSTRRTAAVCVWVIRFSSNGLA